MPSWNSLDEGPRRVKCHSKMLSSSGLAVNSVSVALKSRASLRMRFTAEDFLLLQRAGSARRERGRDPLHALLTARSSSPWLGEEWVSWCEGRRPGQRIQAGVCTANEGEGVRAAYVTRRGRSPATRAASHSLGPGLAWCNRQGPPEAATNPPEDSARAASLFQAAAKAGGAPYKYTLALIVSVQQPIQPSTHLQ